MLYFFRLYQTDRVLWRPESLASLFANWQSSELNPCQVFKQLHGNYRYICFESYLAYLPCLNGLPKDLNTETARRIKRLLFQECYNIILGPLMEVALSGVTMTGPDQYEYRGHPLLAAFICDYPEACLATGTKYGQCPRGYRGKDDLHDLISPCVPKKTEDMVQYYRKSYNLFF